MGGGFERKPGGSSLVQEAGDAHAAGSPGKRTLTEQLAGPETASPGRGSEATAVDTTGRNAAAAKQTMATLAPRFGHAFDGTNVHTGRDGDARAQAHGAKAMAEGNNIYLSSGVDPASAEGHRVMAHEMAHVVQQTGSGSKTEARAYSRDGDAFEKEAHDVGETVCRRRVRFPCSSHGTQHPAGIRVARAPVDGQRRAFCPRPGSEGLR